jgi:hypothetical protein
VFESGRIGPNGAIQGNDSDTDAGRFEPHYDVIRRPDEVAIFESIMGDPQGVVTTGLLTADRFLKDNRLLPRGFDKTTAARDIAVIGGAAEDRDFAGGGDTVRYAINLAGAAGPFRIEAELMYQPISYRWAENLRRYESPETDRFTSYYDSMSAASSETIARTTHEAR